MPRIYQTSGAVAPESPAEQCIKLRNDVLNVKQVLNQVVDDLQLYGWLQ
jgi:hypothetical protein